MPKPPTPPKGSDVKSFVPENPGDIDDIFAGIEGGAAPVETPPVVETPPELEEHIEDEVTDVRNFEPQEYNIDLKTGEEKQPKAPKEKEKKKEETSAIRKELEKIAAEKKAAEEELQKFRDQLKAEADAKKELENRFSTVATEFEEFKKKNAIGNPADLKEVQDIIKPYNRSVRELMQEIQDDGGDSSGLEEWLSKAVPQYMRASAVGEDGKRDDENYKKEFERLRGEASSQFGPEFTRHIMKHVRQGAENAFQVAKVVREVQSNIPAHHFREAQRVYEAEAAEYEEVERGVFNPPEDIKLNDPLNVSVILRAMIDGSEEVKKVAQNAKAATRLGMLPAKPIDPNTVEPERLQDVITSSLNTRQQHFKKIRSILPEALVARAVVPAMWKRIQELEAAVKGQRDVPKPKLDSDGNPQPETKEIGVKEFEPSNPALDEFRQEQRRR